MACLLHLIALATVLNQSVWLFDGTRDCGVFAPAGRYNPGSHLIYARDFPYPITPFILAHEFCHMKSYSDGSFTNNSFIDESRCYIAGVEGLLNPGKYAITERTRVTHGGYWT